MEGISTSTLLVLGTAIFGGTLGATLFQRFRVPQVVGYIVMGLIIGQSGLGLVSTSDMENLQSLNLFALAIIGFLVGGELHKEIFTKYGKQFAAILLGEGLGAFFLVGIPVGIAVHFVGADWPVSIAAGFVFGAISSATDPASTVDVLWEYRGKGVLTTTLIAIVALDDALAMALYGIGTSVAQVLTGQDVAVMEVMMHIGVELGGACVLGIITGLIFRYIFDWLNNPEKSLAVAVGILLLDIGLALLADMDVILTTMAFGVTLTNLAPRRSAELFKVVRSFSTPIYVLFFVLVGARLNLSGMPLWLWGVVGLYLVGRTGGKMAGAYVGARAAGAEPVVQKYTGMGLFAQGGIAVGLSILAGQHLNNVPIGDDGMMLGDMVVFTITATTFCIQLVGPALIKWSIHLADEIGRNVTEEDVVATLTVADVMETEVLSIHASEPVTRVFDTFSNQERTVLPVVNKDNVVSGVITLTALKEIFSEQDTWQWLVAGDVAQSLGETVEPGGKLSKAMKKMQEAGFEFLLVVEQKEAGPVLSGIMDQRLTRKKIRQELLKRQQVAG